ncbi:MAG TPA: hypothetical protein VLF89_04605 [Candidatus Saccharimonadales bacterium]|nr:hypothetical protein [Candidatus Saccharimonadales bacterium]
MNKLTKLSVGIIASASMALVFTGISFAQSYNQGMASWWQMNVPSGTKCYNVYYGAKSNPKQYAVRCVSNKVTSITIKYLNPGVTYYYEVVALGYNGKESTLPTVKPLYTTQMENSKW